METDTPIVPACISPENNELNRIAAELVAEAARLHGTIDIRSLAKEELDAVQ